MAHLEDRQSESPNAVPAHLAWIELATRVTTQPLHYRSGEEEGAAKSVHELFLKVRELMENYPEADEFCEIGLTLLNDTLRPYTARWHGWLTESREDNVGPTLRFRNERVRRMFRTELLELQPRLLDYQAAFKALSKGPQVGPGCSGPNKILPAGKQARLGDQPLVAGIGSQVSVQADFPSAITTDQIDRKERDFIFARRQIHIPKFQPAADAKLEDAIGLALSGGGIRSATVCLGVLQVLAKNKLFAEIDYLSTVSGGGYFGSFLSSYLASGKEKGATKESVDKLLADTFVPGKAGIESGAVRHLRNNSKYLLHGGLWGKLKIAGLMTSGLVTNLLMILPLPLLAVLAIFGLNFVGFWGGIPFTQKPLPYVSLDTPAGLMVKVLLWVFLGLWIILPWIRKATLGKPADSESDKLRGWWSAATLGLGLTAIAAWVCYALPAMFHGYAALEELRNHLGGPLSRLLSGNVIVAMMGALPILLGTVAGLFNRPAVRNLLLGLFVLSGPLFYGWVVLFVGAKIGLTTGSVTWQWQSVALATVVWLLWSWLVVDINTLGPHGYYRDRLCECYLAYRGENQLTWWQAAIRKFWSGRKKAAGPPDSELQKIGVRLRMPLTEMSFPSAAPYHLINTVVNLPASANRELRGRNGDFFILSPFFCGSPICGYIETSLVERSDPHLDLGTAMAISGAAASTNMGWRTLPNYRFLMAVFNVRLGYWLPNIRLLEKIVSRGVGPFYFLAEITGRMQENMKYLNISDGGHIENLGVYELLRRRCKFIICVHGGADLATEGSDLQRLERYASIDLGIKLEYNLADLQPDERKVSRAYAVLIKIIYGPGQIGWMIYLKPAITGAEPQYVLDYQHRNPNFPHEGIVDQTYDEEKFEGYRAVGECAAESLFRPELVGKDFSGTVRDWFQKLADNLLPDNDAAFLREKEEEVTGVQELQNGK
jgi:hypothetical protein